MMPLNEKKDKAHKKKKKNQQKTIKKNEDSAHCLHPPRRHAGQRHTFVTPHARNFFSSLTESRGIRRERVSEREREKKMALSIIWRQIQEGKGRSPFLLTVTTFLLRVTQKENKEKLDTTKIYEKNQKGTLK